MKNMTVHEQLSNDKNDFLSSKERAFAILSLICHIGVPRAAMILNAW